MSAGADDFTVWRQNFRRVFNSRPAQIALLDLDGVIREVNPAWREFGWGNGLSASYECVGKNYLQVCEQAAMTDTLFAKAAYVGMLEVIHTRRPKFTLVYPCHSPTERRWYRLWVQPQMPEVPAVVVAHYLCADKSSVIHSNHSSFGINPVIAGSLHSRSFGA